MLKVEKSPKEKVEKIIPQPIDMSVQKVTPMLIEILIYGLAKDKDKVSKLFEKIQLQIDLTKQVNRVRILWYLDEGEKTDEEKEKWLVENSSCYYYAILNAEKIKFDVPITYVKELTKAIRKFRDAITGMKEMGAQLKQKAK